MKLLHVIALLAAVLWPFGVTASAQNIGDVLEADRAERMLAKCHHIVRICHKAFDREFMARTGMTDEQQFAFGAVCARINESWILAKETNPNAGERITKMAASQAMWDKVRTDEQKDALAKECHAEFGDSR